MIKVKQLNIDNLNEIKEAFKAESVYIVREHDAEFTITDVAFLTLREFANYIENDDIAVISITNEIEVAIDEDNFEDNNSNFQRIHCEEALKQIVFDSYAEASHFWHNDILGKIMNGNDKFIPVSMVLDIYNYSGTRHWYEGIFGWKRNYLVLAIENMTVAYNNQKAYVVLPMVMTKEEIAWEEKYVVRSR